VCMDTLENASAILRREQLAKILRIYDFFADEENRKKFAEKGYNYGTIARTFNLNGIELEAVLEYVCRYSKEQKNKPVCEILQKAREAKESDSKPKRRVDKNKQYIKDDRIKEIERLFTETFTESGELKAEKEKQITKDDYQLLKEELMQEIDKRLSQRSTQSTPTQTSRYSRDEQEEIAEQPQAPKETPKVETPPQTSNTTSEEQVENTNELLAGDEEINVKVIKPSDKKHPKMKPAKTGKGKFILQISIFIALCFVFAYAVYVVFFATAQTTEQTPTLPSNISEAQIEEPNDEANTNDEEIILKVHDEEKENEANMSAETDVELQEAQALKAELEAERERQAIELQKLQEEQAKELKAERERLKRERIANYTQEDIAKAHFNGIESFTIESDTFRVGSEVGKYEVLDIAEDYIDVLHTKEGYPFKIYKNK